jgi:hypothetical protein
MTAAEWDRSDDPGRMLDAAGRRLSDRKLLLFACGCARRVWDLLPEGARTAVPLAEQAADADTPELRDESLREALIAVGGVLAPLLMANPSPAAIARYAVILLRGLEGPTAEPPGGAAVLFSLARFIASFGPQPHPAQAAVLRCVAGNPFRRTPRDPSWLTSDVLALAAGVYADGAFDRLPILADAFQDAGCASDRVLSHLRSAGPHSRGCWVVDLILGKS